MTQLPSASKPNLTLSRELGSFWGAEFLSGGIAVGAMYAFQQIPDKLIDPVAAAIGKVIVPIQPGIEKVLGAVSHIDAAKANKEKPVEERAQNFAKKIVLQAMPALAISWGSKMGVRSLINDWGHAKQKTTFAQNAKKFFGEFKFWKWNWDKWKLFGLDEGTHTVVGLGMQSKVGAPHTNRLIDNMTTIGVNLGCSEQDSHDTAVLVASHEIPNLIAGLSVSAEIANRHLGWTKMITSRFGQKQAAAAHKPTKLILEDGPYDHVADLLSKKQRPITIDDRYPGFSRN